MSDEIIFNFEYNPDIKPLSIVEACQQMFMAVKKRALLAEQRFKDPNWHYQPVHIMSKEIEEALNDPATSISTKAWILHSTYAGHQWIYIGEDNITAIVKEDYQDEC